MADHEGLLERSLKEELRKDVVVLGVELQGLGELWEEEGEFIVSPLLEFLDGEESDGVVSHPGVQEGQGLFRGQLRPDIHHLVTFNHLVRVTRVDRTQEV